MRAALIALLLLAASPGWAQWTHRYKKVEGYSHHVYLEGFELPILAASPTDPAPSPDGGSLAFAAYGYIWILDLETRVATRLTRGAGVDSRPAWAPDGSSIAFLRDDASDLDILSVDVQTGAMQALVDTDAIELDPAYSADGAFLYYSSAEAGDLDLWRLQIATREKMRLTSSRGLERRPLPRPDGESVVFLDKRRGGIDRVVELEIGGGAERELMSQSIVSQAHPGLSADGDTVVVNWPAPENYDLWLVDLEGGDPIRLNARAGLPLAPAFSPDGDWVYFVEADDQLTFHVYRVRTVGGDVERVSIRAWDWREPMAFVRIQTTAPARLSVTDRDGHPVVVPQQMPRFDGTHGKVFWYSPGVVTVQVPEGPVRVTAAHGFSSLPASGEVDARAGETATLDLEFEKIWDPRDDGWYSGDHHYHMNYGGPYRLVPQDLLKQLRAEDVDVGTPLMANLQHRFNDVEFFNYRRLGHGAPLLSFGQEIRSHFLGHVGIINVDAPFWPWYWGPGYPVYGSDDRPNVDVLAHARRQGGVSSYMHPVSIADPFADEDSLRAIPVDVIPDAVLGDLDALEIACLWINEMGTSELWYRFLNVGATIAASAGTDTMADYYRTMAVGTTRLYVKVDGELHLESYLEALRQGRSFVSTGPLLDFRVDGVLPGGVVDGDAGTLAFELRLASTIAVDRVEILVNGKPVWDDDALSEAGERRFQGEIEVGTGGWIAARVQGGGGGWPGMNGFAFAHTSPIWLGERGSTDPTAAAEAARDLLRALDVAFARVQQAYEGVETPRLDARFNETRDKLQAIVGEP